MPTQIITGDNANEATFSGASDGAFKVRVGPNGAKVDGLSVDATGNVDVLAGLTQQGGEAVPRMKQFTAQATTSGTFVDFTGIPSWAKKITFILNGISSSGTNQNIIQLGSGGAPQTTGYQATAWGGSSGSVPSSSNIANGVPLSATVSAANIRSGTSTFTKVSGNTWVASGNWISSDVASFGFIHTGIVTLSGDLDIVRLTTANGTDVFDAGSVNILVEGY